MKYVISVPLGTAYPELCPNGTYTLSTDSNLEDDTECRPCDTGKYCTGGRIQVIVTYYLLVMLLFRLDKEKSQTFHVLHVQCP